VVRGAPARPSPKGQSNETVQAAPPVADINVTPMVDVMLVMLIIFMVITPMLSHASAWTW